MSAPLSRGCPRETSASASTRDHAQSVTDLAGIDLAVQLRPPAGSGPGVAGRLAGDAGHSELPKSLWHIELAMEDSLDLYASDAVQIHFNALRGLLIGLVKDSGFSDSPVVTWDEDDGRILNVSGTRTPP
jgi:hypothetical protein